MVGHDGGTNAPSAALVNGTAAHALDFDDDFDPAKAHPTAVLAPALIALAEQTRASGEQLLDAYIVGLQMIGRVGQGLNPFHRSRGWHATSTVGTVGAAAGCARLLGLDAEKTAHAISLSTSLAGGFMSQFGTMTKPLHAGIAAEGAVKAALMAAAGITAGSETLDGKTGMRTLMVGPDVEALKAEMEGTDYFGQKVAFETQDVGHPLLIEQYGLKVKCYPNCGSLHRTLDAVLHLVHEHSFAPDDVVDVLVRLPGLHARNLMYDRPTTPMQAKFSLEYSVASALFHGEVTLEHYLPAQINNADVRAMMPLVRKDVVEKRETEFPTEVVIRLRDGRELRAAVQMQKGTSANPMSADEILAKFRACARSMPPEKAAELEAALVTLESLPDVRAMTTLLRTAHP